MKSPKRVPVVHVMMHEIWCRKEKKKKQKTRLSALHLDSHHFTGYKSQTQTMTAFIFKRCKLLNYHYKVT